MYRSISTSATTKIDGNLGLNLLIFNDMGIERHISSPWAFCPNLNSEMCWYKYSQCGLIGLTWFMSDRQVSKVGRRPLRLVRTRSMWLPARYSHFRT